MTVITLYKPNGETTKYSGVRDFKLDTGEISFIHQPDSTTASATRVSTLLQYLREEEIDATRT